ncbi:MAG: hypothetical protein ACO263_08100, partial [Cyclobacteriaceae bacterium]
MNTSISKTLLACFLTLTLCSNAQLKHHYQSDFSTAELKARITKLMDEIVNNAIYIIIATTKIESQST